jgi:uncharacterized repeat protein (TIGR03833 family)
MSADFANDPRFAHYAGVSGTERRNVPPGTAVSVVLKADQPTGKRTKGIVKDILTSSPVHPRGIKVRLEDGQVGRVQEVFST